MPVWAEQSTPTSWHPHHIAERFGLFTLIVLGESVAAGDHRHPGRGGRRRGGGRPRWTWPPAACSSCSRCGGCTSPSPSVPSSSGPGHRSTRAAWRQAFLWGYGHYVVFASAAAVGAGLAVAADQAIGHTDLSARAATACVAVPAALYVLSVWVVHVTAKPAGPVRVAPPCAAVLVVARRLSRTAGRRRRPRAGGAGDLLRAGRPRRLTQPRPPSRRRRPAGGGLRSRRCRPRGRRGRAGSGRPPRPSTG